MIPEIIAEFGQVFAFARSRWMRYAEQVHPELRGVGMIILQIIATKGPVAATDLARLLDMDKAVVSRQVTKLRRFGMVEARSDEKDRRMLLLTASDEGLQILAGLHALRSKAYEQRFEGWSEEDLATLATLLHRFNAAPIEGQSPE